MENRINQVVTLENGNKFLIMHQAVYNNDNYYVCVKLTEDGEDATEDFVLFHEVKDNNDKYLELVEDPDLAKFIFEHLNMLQKEA